MNCTDRKCWTCVLCEERCKRNDPKSKSFQCWRKYLLNNYIGIHEAVYGLSYDGNPHKNLWVWFTAWMLSLNLYLFITYISLPGCWLWFGMIGIPKSSCSCYTYTICQFCSVSVSTVQWFFFPTYVFRSSFLFICQWIFGDWQMNECFFFRRLIHQWRYAKVPIAPIGSFVYRQNSYPSISVKLLLWLLCIILLLKSSL